MLDRPKHTVPHRHNVAYIISICLTLIWVLFPAIVSAKAAPHTPNTALHSREVGRVTARIIRPAILRNGKVDQSDYRVTIRRTGDCPNAAKRPETPCRLIVVNFQ